MGAKVVVIIATGEQEKALTGLIYAYRSKSQGWGYPYLNEMVIYELMKEAGTELFKKVLPLVK